MSVLVSFGFLRNTLKSKFPPKTQSVISLKETLGKQPVWKISNVVLDTISGYVFDNQGRFVSESSSWEASHALERMPANPIFPRSFKAKGNVTFLGAEAYYHWLLEDFPAFLRVYLASSELTVGIRYSSPLYVHNALEILGIDSFVMPLYSKVKSLLISEKSRALSPSPNDVELLEHFQKVADLEPSQIRKIYISRKDSGRYPENEDDIQSLVKKLGFTVIELGSTSLKQQISLFAGADVVTGTHGAGLSNIVWMKRNHGRVIEISKKFQPDCFEQISAIKHLAFSRVCSDSEDKWIVDLNQLEKILS